MATDLPISGLPAIPSVAATDKIEVLDVSNQANHSTGENTFATVTQIAAAIAAINGSGGGSPFVGAGTGHAAGQVPDPGATAHATPYILGDDGTFHPLAGTALSYSGGTYTFTAGTGGSATPGGTSGQVQVNAAGAFGGADLTALLDAMVGSPAQGTILFRDAASWNKLAPGTNGQFLKSLGAGANPAWAASPAGSRARQFAVTNIGNPATGTTPVSLFGSPMTIIGSRTIPANTLGQGSVISGYFNFDTKIITGDTVNLAITVNGTTVLQGISSAATVTVAAGLAVLRFDIFFLTGGAAAATRNSGKYEASGLTAGTTACGMLLSSAGLGAPSAAVPLDQTTALTIDILCNFSSAAGGDVLRIDGGAVFIDV